MAAVETVKETITINRVGPYGVLVGETWYGVNEPLTPKSFNAGSRYDVLVKIGAKKKYITEIVTAIYSTSTVAAPAPASAPSTGSSSYQDQQADKNISIKRQGLYQAALQSPALAAYAMNKDEFLKLVEEVSEAGIRFVERR